MNTRQGRGRTGRVFSIVAVLAAAALALGACGDDGDETTTAAEVAASGAPEPAGSLDEAVAELNEAIASQDCEAIVGLTFSMLRSNAAGDGPSEPGEPVRPEECGEEAPAVPLLEDIEGTTFDESEDYGSAAISTGSGGKPIQGYDEWTVIWLVDRDAQWRQLAFFPADPQFEEDLPETVDPVAVTEQMIDAVQTGDCTGAEEFISEQAGFGAGQEGCETLAGGSIFAPAVKAAGDDVAVELIGESRDYAIVGVDTGETYFATVLGTPIIEAGQPVQDEIQVQDVLPQTEFEMVEPEEESKN